MSAYGEAVLDGEQERVRMAPKGNRNNTIYVSSLRVGRVIVGSGMDYDEAEEILYQAGLVSHFANADKVPKGLRDELRGTIRSGLNKGMTDPKSIRATIESREDAIEEVIDHLVAFMQCPMGGHTANRQWPVMLAICALGLLQGGPSGIRAPMRKIRIIAGLGSLTTTTRGVGDLLDQGFLTLNTRGDGSRSSSYNLTGPADVQSWNTPTHPPGLKACSTLALNGHDAFRPKALGRCGQRIMGCLVQHPDQWFTQTALANLVGCCAASINRHVQPDRGLVKYGLVERGPRGQVRLGTDLTQEVLDGIAFAMKTRGKGDRQRRWTARWYQQQGYLTDDLYWIDQATGEVTNHHASWLEPTSVIQGGSMVAPTPAATQTSPAYREEAR